MSGVSVGNSFIPFTQVQIAGVCTQTNDLLAFIFYFPTTQTPKSFQISQLPPKLILKIPDLTADVPKLIQQPSLFLVHPEIYGTFPTYEQAQAGFCFLPSGIKEAFLSKNTPSLHVALSGAATFIDYIINV